MSYTELVHTRYGEMLVPRNDTAQTPALRNTGHALCHQDIDLLRHWLGAVLDKPILLDIGANIGSFSFGCRDLCAEVHAFEPQRLIFNMLAGSIALNGWTNIYAYHMALANNNGVLRIPQFDFNYPLNFGGVEFGPVQREPIGQPRMQDNTSDNVDVRSLDTAFTFDRIDVMKIDVEGMEVKVLAGARDTILRHKPRILIEHAKVGAGNLRPVLEGLGYDVQLHGTMDFACTPRS